MTKLKARALMTVLCLPGIIGSLLMLYSIGLGIFSTDPLVDPFLTFIYGYSCCLLNIPYFLVVAFIIGPFPSITRLL